MEDSNVSCIIDEDCLGSRICFIANQSWSDVTMCSCNTYYGFSGENCTESLDEPNGIFLFSVGIIGIPITLMFTMVTIHNLYHLFKVSRNRSVLLGDAVFLSSVYFFVSGSLFLTYCSMLVALPLNPLQATLSSDKSTMFLESAMQYILSIALMFTAFGIITVSSGFLEMTVVLSNRRRRIIKLLYFTYVFTFFFLVLGLVISRQIFLALLVGFPYIIILAVAYITGLSLLTRKIAKHMATRRGSHTRNQGDDPAYNSLRSAQKSIFFLCLALLMEILLGIVWLVSSYFVGWRFVTPPAELSPVVTGAILWLPALLAAMAVTRDLSQWRRIRVARVSGLGAHPSGKFHFQASEPRTLFEGTRDEQLQQSSSRFDQAGTIRDQSQHSVMENPRMAASSEHTNQDFKENGEGKKDPTTTTIPRVASTDPQTTTTTTTKEIGFLHSIRSNDDNADVDGNYPSSQYTPDRPQPPHDVQVV